MAMTFRPHVRAIFINGDVWTWHCEHHHKTLNAAALCGQLTIRSITPNTSDKTEHVRFEQIHQRVLVRRERGATYITVQSYREQYGPLPQ